MKIFPICLFLLLALADLTFAQSEVVVDSKINDVTVYRQGALVSRSGNASVNSVKATLFFKGIYQGETYMDLQSFDDTLTLSVGRDKDILIEREIQKDFTKKVSIGSSKKETKAWETKVLSLQYEVKYPKGKRLIVD